MKMGKVYWICFLMVWVACKDRTETQNLPTPDMKGYCPLKPGKYIIYAVDSTLYNGFYSPPRITQAHYFLKELIADSFLDASNQVNYRIERYRRNADTGNWKVDGVSFAVRTPNTFERVDDNLRFIKLAAPINYYATWQGNVHINTTLDAFSFLDGWQYQYKNIEAPGTYNGMTFNKTIMVKQIDAADAVQDRVGYEKYAQGVGLIYREFTYYNNFNYDTMPYPKVGWPARATDGFSIIMTVKDHN